MNLSSIKEEWESGKIDKWLYIEKMYEIHSYLFQYADFIKSTNISNIEISAGSLIMTFRDSGVKFILCQNDKRLVPFEVINFGDYERPELEMQMKLIKPGISILDIGANFGWFSMHIAKKINDTKVFSFEPVPSTFEYLLKNIELNKIKNIKCFNFGFADIDGSFKFYVDPELSANASMVKLSDSNSVVEQKCIVKKIDDFVSHNKIPVDFIKCDVEGAELLVFKGGAKTISEQQPIVFAEMLRKWSSKFDYHPNDIISFFKNLNYRCFVIENNMLKPFDWVDEKTIETNYFFLHEEKHSIEILNFEILE